MIIDPATKGQAAAGAASAAGSLLTADWTVEIFGVPLAVVLAGFAGALVALSFQPEKLGRGRMAAIVLSGTLIAAYITPLAVHYSELPSKLALGVAFAIGLLVQFVVGLILQLTPLAIKAVPEWLSAIGQAIARRIGGGGP